MSDINLSDLIDKHKNDTRAYEAIDAILMGDIVPIKSNSALDKINPITFQQIQNDNPEPIIHLLEPWLPYKGSALIYAAAGVGKTLFTLNVAYALCSGGNFLKYSAPSPKRVLYVDGEMTYSIMHSRLMDIVNQQGKLTEFTQDNFFLLTPDKVYPLKLPKIDTPEGQLFYNRIMEENKIDVVIFDNFATLSVFDESSAEEWKFLQDWFIELRSGGKTIICVHHAGKDGKGYRGTSKMLDCVDTAISLQNLSGTVFESEITNVKKFKIDYQKSRTFGGLDSLAFEVILSMGVWTCESVEKNNTTKIIEMYRDLGIKPNDIALELCINRSHVYKIIKKFCPKMST